MKEGYSTFYVINIVFQSIFTLLWQIGTALLVGWIFVRFVNAPPWIYVPLIMLGVISGFVSMVRFILAAMKSLERIEDQRRKKGKQHGK
jgi:F0F1-type ATP synthase assembly protein I